MELLESAGLITGRADPQGRRPRRVFETTQAGEAALRDWLTRDEPMLFELRDTGLLKIFFADALDPCTGAYPAPGATPAQRGPG